MRILILTQYFPPETGAPQNRLYNLARRLQLDGHHVEILTAMPNYPAYRIFPGYRSKIYTREETDGLTIHRSWIYVSRKRHLFYRLMNYFSFTVSSFFAGVFKIRQPDWIICESPPLFMGISAYLLKSLKNARLLFNVSDLWPESAVELGLVRNKTAIRLSTRLEEFIYRHSNAISGQTQGIVKNIGSRFPDKPIFWLRNGVDIEDLKNRLSGKSWRKVQQVADPENFWVYYGGLIGYAQGLEVLLDAALQLKEEKGIEFIIVGEGPEKERLIALKETWALENVHFLPGMSRYEIPNVIDSMDIGVIPLRNIELFKGAIPSKIFEISALGKPILLGLNGEAKQLFVDEANAGLAFEPEDGRDLAQKILQLYRNKKLLTELGKNGKTYVTEHFNQNIISRQFQQFLQTATLHNS